jgi:hypothetical protein
VVRRAVVLAGIVVASFILAGLAYLVFAPSPQSTPCYACGGPGTSLALNRPLESTSANGSHLYNFSVVSSGGGLVWSDTGFSLENASGGRIPTTGGGWSVTVYSLGGAVAATYSLGSETPAWTTGGDVLVTATQSVLVVSPAADSLEGHGDALLVMGEGTVQGSIAISIP